MRRQLRRCVIGTTALCTVAAGVLTACALPLSPKGLVRAGAVPEVAVDRSGEPQGEPAGGLVEADSLALVRARVPTSPVPVEPAGADTLVRTDSLALAVAAPAGNAGAVGPAEPAPRGQPVVADPIQGRWIRVDREYPRRDYRIDNRPLVELLQYMAEESGVTIVPSEEPAVRDALITGVVRDQPWHIALETLLEAHGFIAIQDRQYQTILVATTQRAQDQRQLQEIRLNYLFARDLEPIIRDMLLQGRDSAAASVKVFGRDETSRQLVVYASPEQIASMQELVRQMDRRPPRVSVEVRLTQINRTNIQKLGASVTFGTLPSDSAGRAAPAMQFQQLSALQKGITSDLGPAVQLIRRLGGTPLQVNLFLDALTSAGLAETETAPMIMSNSGVTSRIMVGDAYILPNNQPLLAGGGYAGYFPGGPIDGGAQSGLGPQYPGGPGQGMPVGGAAPPYPGSNIPSMPVGGFARFETGTVLEVTPYVLDNGEVSMQLDLARDGGTLSPDGRSITGGKQSTRTEITVENNTPIVIGGLTINGHSDAETGIPGLGSLPLVGRFFRRDESATTYSDLVIVLTPHILDGDLVPAPPAQ